jgi:hypothetical protein
VHSEFELESEMTLSLRYIGWYMPLNLEHETKSVLTVVSWKNPSSSHLSSSRFRTCA